MIWTFNPILKRTIWGGTRIAALKRLPDDGASFDDGRIGESWEVSAIPGCESVVSDGVDSGLTITELCRKYGDRLLGKSIKARFGDEFPVLVKIIDAGDDLSIQVHPDDEFAKKLSIGRGKSEMWYVLESAEDSKVCLSFAENLTSDEILKATSDGSIVDRLVYEGVTAGDAFYIPAGTLHGLGKGSLVVEVQQTSDVTFRVFDYLRTDSDGRMRELHTDLALKALKQPSGRCGRIDYNRAATPVASIINTNDFTVNRLRVVSELTRMYDAIDSFKVLVVVSGEVEVSIGEESVKLTKGNSVLVSADQKDLSLKSVSECAELMETYID